MSGNSRTPSTVPAPRWTVWARHDKVGKWIPLLTGLTGEEAVNEVWTRQDRLRRQNEPAGS